MLRDRITIERSTFTRNQDGSENLSWSVIWRGRARVEQSSGTQSNLNGETFNTVTKRVTIRTKPAIRDIPSQLRVLIDSRYYRILSIDVRQTDMATIMIVELINQ